MEKEKELKIKDENYFQISGWMINKLGLKGNTLMVYAIIYGFSQDGESYFSGSRKYLCDFIGATKPTIDKSLQELIEKNYIFKYSEKINDITHNKYKINLDVVNFTSGKETLLGGKEIAPNNIEYNIDKENIIIDDNNIKEKATKFQKPTLEELQSYINEKGYHFSAEAFIDYYDSVGWKIGSHPMRSWTSACNTWERKYKENNSNNNPYSRQKEISKETAYPNQKNKGYI